jgi:hypothetical protein
VKTGFHVYLFRMTTKYVNTTKYFWKMVWFGFFSFVLFCFVFSAEKHYFVQYILSMSLW